MQDTCNLAQRRCCPRPATIQMTALVLSGSSDEESSDSDATWGWCSDSNDQGQAEQVAQSQIIVHLCRGAGDKLGVGRLLGDHQVLVSDLVHEETREALARARTLWLTTSVRFVLLASCSLSCLNQIIHCCT